MTEGPVQWAYAADCTASSLGIPQPQFQQAIDRAVEWLWSRTGRRYGTRTVVYRPQTRARGVPGWPGIGLQPFGAATYSGMWGFDSDWAPERDQTLELPPPVASVESVTINGTIVDPQIWRVEGNWLVRQDGGYWPRTQNMIAALGSADTWAVSYTRGTPPSPFGQYATGRLICYFGGLIGSGKPCVMPYNTTRVTRAGVSIERDPGKAGQTSPVPEVDQWIQMVNPNGLTSEPLVWSPDVDRGRWPFAGSYLQTTAPQGMSIGDITQLADFLVLGPTDPVPAGTPVGTVIFRSDQ